GPVLPAMVELTIPAVREADAGVAGEVVYVDHFGNLVTNVDAAMLARFPAGAVSVTIEGTRVAGPVTAYAAVPEGTPLAIVGSWGMMEMGVCNGSAAGMFAAGPGTPVTVGVGVGASDQISSRNQRPFGRRRRQRPAGAVPPNRRRRQGLT